MTHVLSKDKQTVLLMFCAVYVTIKGGSTGRFQRCSSGRNTVVKNMTVKDYRSDVWFSMQLLQSKSRDGEIMLLHCMSIFVSRIEHVYMSKSSMLHRSK